MVARRFITKSIGIKMSCSWKKVTAGHLS